MDRVLVQDRFNGLMVSVRWRRRAIPLAWRVLPSKRGMSTFKQQQALFTPVATLLPGQCRVLVTGDREFGRPKLMHWLDQQGWRFYLRVKGNLEMSDQQGTEGVDWQRLAVWSLEDDCPVFLQALRFTQGELLRVKVALQRAKGRDDPWYLVTHAPANRTPLQE
jgi:hypothetical protein